MSKRILVMMSAYNGEHYISEQIRSIMTQNTACELTLRIRDDGSQDCTCEIIRNLQLVYPGRIELITGNNLGYNDSFFKLLAEASGFDYYVFSDQDDVWLPNKLQTAIEWIEKESRSYSGPILYASTSYLVEDDMQPYGITRKQFRPFTLYNTIIQNICPGHNQVMNQALLNIVKETIGGAYVYVYDSWVTNIAMLYGKVLFNNEPQTYYRQHKSNQLGSGGSVITQLLTSFRHSTAGHGLKYRKQIESFVEVNKIELERKNFLPELQRFITAKSFFNRLFYSLRGKLYRQKRIETITFYCAVILRLF